MGLCRLSNPIGSIEHLALKNLKENSFRKDGEVGKVQKEKKNSCLCSLLVLLFNVTFILQKAIIENICKLLRWKALKNVLSHDFAAPKL